MYENIKYTMNTDANSEGRDLLEPWCNLWLVNGYDRVDE